MQLIEDDWTATAEHRVLKLNPDKFSPSPFLEEELSRLWHEGVQKDGEYRDIRRALTQENRCFPPSVKIKISIPECSIDKEGFVRWRERLLIPQYEPLQTALIHRAHDSPVTGHPGREVTLSILSRDFY